MDMKCLNSKDPEKCTTGDIKDACEVKSKGKYFKIFRAVVFKWEKLCFPSRGHLAVPGDFLVVTAG